MKNTRKILLGYLLTMMFVLGVTLVGCGDDCGGKVKPATGECSDCAEDTTRAGYCAP